MTLTTNLHERSGCGRARVIGTEKITCVTKEWLSGKCGDIIQPQIDLALRFTLITFLVSQKQISIKSSSRFCPDRVRSNFSLRTPPVDCVSVYLKKKR